MAKSTSAIVPTESSSRYLQQLCKHWSHRLDVVFDSEHGEVSFPNGARAVMDVKPEGLRVKVYAPDAELLVRTQNVVQVHLDRFAFREAPLSFQWELD